jgi:hypothetical protein
MMRTRLVVYGLLAGLGWGAVAWALGGKAFGRELWAGIAASPFIGVAVALAVQSRFAAATGYRRSLWALVSLYGGTIVFGLVIGLATELRVSGPGHVPFAAVWEGVAAVLWGITIGGFVIVLWPLAYATHWAIEQLD